MPLDPMDKPAGADLRCRAATGQPLCDDLRESVAEILDHSGQCCPLQSGDSVSRLNFPDFSVAKSGTVRVTPSVQPSQKAIRRCPSRLIYNVC